MSNDTVGYINRIVKNYGKVRRILDSGRYDLGLTGVIVLQENISNDPAILELEQLFTVSKLNEGLSDFRRYLRNPIIPNLVAKWKLKGTHKQIKKLEHYNGKENEMKERYRDI